jgi:hypothetical protein
MENNSLIVELNNKKYLLVEILVIDENKERIRKKCKEFNCIYQGVKEIVRGFLFFDGYVIIRALVPEENVIKWNESEWD